MKYLVFLFLLCVSILSYGQELKKIDLGINSLSKSTEFYKNRAYDSAYIQGKKTLEFFQEIKNDSLIAEIASLLVSVTTRVHKNERNLFYNLSKEKALKTMNWKLLGLLYQKKGTYHYNNFQDDLAMSYFLKSDSLLSSKNIIDITKFDNLIRITKLILYSGQAMDSLRFKKAKNYIDKSIKIAEQLDYSSGKSVALNTYSSLLTRNGRHQESLTIQRKALEIILKSDDTLSISSIYWNMATNHLILKNNDSSEFYFNKRVKLFEGTNRKDKLALAYSGLGAFYKNTNQFKKGIYYQLKALKIYRTLRSNHPGEILGTMNGLANAYAGDMNYKEAYDLLLVAYRYSDSLTNVKNQKVTLELEAKYQTEKKGQEIALLTSQKELIEQQKTNQRNQLLGGIGFTSFIGLFFFLLYRNRQKTTRKLRELDLAKSNFFANISHEFRTPLTMISGPIQSKLQKENLSAEDKSNFGMMHRNATRLLSLVDQLLDISKIEAGNLQLKISKQNLFSFIGSIADSFTHQAAQKELNYLVYNNPVDIDAYFDSDIVEKITVNLLSNAIKYTPQKGSIVCNTTVKNGHLYFTVKNTGKGLTKTDVSNIFERFYQVNENRDGVGIGLALVKELVKLHKGNITVDSIPNDWTTFEVVIPISKDDFSKNEFNQERRSTIDLEEQMTPEDSIVEKNDSGDEIEENPILLIIDDNLDIRNYVSGLFKKSYTILKAEDGQEGLNLALERIPDIIISDIMMPNIGGIELCNTLKEDERTSHIPIILLTAKAGEENEIEGIKTGADEYITKPFNEKLLKIRVEKLIENRKKLQLRYSQEVVLKPKDIAITTVDEQFLERLQDVLDTKLVESSFSSENFSKAVGMSRMQLHRKLKALTGLSASEFIRSQRLKLAAQLLKKSEINVSQVGYSVGFNDHAYFSKCFKEMYHCTPTEYVKSFDKEN